MPLLADGTYRIHVGNRYLSATAREVTLLPVGLGQEDRHQWELRYVGEGFYLVRSVAQESYLHHSEVPEAGERVGLGEQSRWKIVKGPEKSTFVLGAVQGFSPAPSLCLAFRWPAAEAVLEWTDLNEQGMSFTQDSHVTVRRAPLAAATMLLPLRRSRPRQRPSR
ncbi:hypothetical protein FM076_00635 [Streptomyces albus subsp. chlorinus]|uniref:hypothetical protein n=1 Tax=Streptomyces albus TaxID=1888 RepID=UPI00156E5830|nr:hypothetical protein [Streptomyces albus]NSC19801.1 hypothetical protein [Streptomyces albus subsp. chlorinus]